VSATPLSASVLAKLATQLPLWTVTETRGLERRLRFPDFAAALDFVNACGQLAEQAGHHPDFELGYGRVVVRLLTHEASAITTKDTALAAQIDRLAPTKEPR